MNPLVMPGMGATTYRHASGISKSDLDVFAECPAKYKAKLDGLLPKEESPAMTFGTLLHSLVLDGRAEYHTKPDGMTFASKEGKAWKADHADKPIVSQDEAAELVAMSTAILRHHHAAPLFGAGSAEVSLFGTHKRTGLAVKGRPDWLAQRHIVDLKTTQDASNKGFSRSIAAYRYHVQAAMYVMLAQQNGMDVNDFYFVAIERGPVPLINVRLLSQAAIERGRIELDRQLEDLLECQSTNVWPDYSGSQPKPDTIDLPPWAYTDMTGAEELLTGSAMETTTQTLDLIP